MSAQDRQMDELRELELADKKQCAENRARFMRAIAEANKLFDRNRARYWRRRRKELKLALLAKGDQP